MRKSFLGVIAFALIVGASSRGEAAPSVIVVDVTGGSFDAARVRNAVGRELGATTVASDDARAATATGRIAIDARGSTLTVTYRKKGAPESDAISRSVDLPSNAERAESSAIILAGNVARDEAGDLLAALKTPAGVKGPPPPTPAQQKALKILTEEVSAYERGAKDYRETVAMIARIHHEAKRKEILAGKDRELAIEKAELVRARAVAIVRLEELIAKYGGQARPEVPDAMYRLAALYEERARSEDSIVPVERGLAQAIRLYKRLLREYPSYREAAGVHYFLGHALNDAGRIAEAQQVWRSLVCKNHFAYPVAADPKDPDRDQVAKLPQDADEAYWTDWRRRYSDPKSPKQTNAETSFVDPFPSDCKAVPQPSVSGDPKYVAEVWWQIGNWEFDQLDLGSGVTKQDPGSVWGYNRAASAYAHALAFKKPPIYGVALYKHAWTLFKQQRYEAATSELVKLLAYTDEEQRRTGDSGADFRSEAFTYIAASLANVDFKGPEAWEPFILRPDIIDTEPDRVKAEKKLHVAIDRMKDPSVVPQDKPWTIEIYRALATEMRGLDQLANAIEIYDVMLKKWPMHPTAPDTVASIADAWDQAYVARKAGTPEHDLAAAKALEARTRLAQYVGTTPWVDANKDDPNALRNAERLVRAGLRNAAATHTNLGRAAVEAGNLERAVSEYDLAARGWKGYVALDHASDSYESRYWLADARRNYVRAKVKLHEASPKVHAPPSKKEIDEALLAAIEVRDSNEEVQYLDNAAFFVVDVTDVERDLAYLSGTPKRLDVRFDSEDPRTRKVVKDQIPASLQQSMKARDDYARVVPTKLDVHERALEYRYWIAETYFLYGHWEQAKARFEAMWKERCGVDKWGTIAWQKLVTMAAKERDEARALALVDAVDAQKGGKSCNATEEKKLGEPVRQAATWEKARKRFDEVCEAGASRACKDPESAKKKPAWREVGALFESALETAPASDDAPEGALTAAQAYKLAGDNAKAAALYERFLRDYGTKSAAGTLTAYEGLAAAQYASLDYTKAAETYSKIAEDQRFEQEKRRSAAKNAIVLHASAGRRAPLLAAHATLLSLKPSAEDRLDADHRVATFDWRQWDKNGSDLGANRDIRRRAQVALTQFWQAHRSETNAAPFLVEAAYAIATMKKAGDEKDYRPWLANVVTAWDTMKATKGADAQRAPYVDWAAEAAYAIIDEDITRRFDLADKHVYPSRVPEILGDPSTGAKGRYQVLAEEAKVFDRRLQDEVIAKYESLVWVPNAIARQGAIFDTLRGGLYDTTKPKLFSENAERLIAGLRASGRDAQADALEDAGRDFWLQKKRKELEGADEVMVRRYATALAYAKKYDLKSAALTKAAARLAHYTDLLGDDKMRAWVTQTPDPNKKGAMLEYTTSMYNASRPGVVPPPKPNGDPKLPPTRP